MDTKDFIETNKRKLVKLRNYYKQVISRPSHNTTSNEDSEIAIYKQSFATSNNIRAQIQERLPEIERALAKINQGTYGICEKTGEFIGYKRLKAIPWARYSINN